MPFISSDVLNVYTYIYYGLYGIQLYTYVDKGAACIERQQRHVCVMANAVVRNAAK